MTTITVTVADETFPIEWEAVTGAQQSAAWRATGVSVGEVVAAGSFTPNDLREVVAMVGLSVAQMGLAVDHDWIGAHMNLGQPVAMSFDDGPADDDPSVADLPPELAAAVRAHRSAQIARDSAAGVIETP